MCWIANAIVVHVLLLGYLLQIHFHSNLIENLKPQRTLRELDLEPPADRLVIFFIDGLGANTFFNNNCAAVPQIRELFLQQGLVGIIRTNVPTNSRPANVATFGGFPEDPSAIFTNFDANPTSFDTVFNRSRSTYGWGSIGVLEFFDNMPNGGVNLKFENYTDRQITLNCAADEWVSGRVKDFLAQDKNVNEVLNTTTSVFYIYLADMDMAGHIYNPKNDLYLKQLHSTQQRIRDMYDLFQEKFKDNRTVYLMTSDHGMTNFGSHGGGSFHETVVPFFFWGAGVNRKASNDGMTFTDLQLPFYQLDQIQLASLMSALIGLPPPMNNLGILPLGFLKATPKYEAQAAHLNALQLLEQVTSVLKRHGKWLSQFQKLNLKDIGHYNAQIERLFQLGCYQLAMNNSHEAAELAVECLEFYKNYYRSGLIAAMIASYLGWLYYLLLKLSNKEKKPTGGLNSSITRWLMLLGLLLVSLMLLQKIPGWTAFYLSLPIPMWILALRERPIEGRVIVAPITHTIWIGSISSLLVAAFFDRRLLWMGFVLFRCACNRQGFAQPSVKFVTWFFLVVLLGLFTMVPPSLGRRDTKLLSFSMLFALLRPLVLREHHKMRIWIINGCTLVMGAYLTYRKNDNVVVLMVFRQLAIANLAYGFICIPFSSSTTAQCRLNLIWFNLSTIYTLLSTSFESFFMQLLLMECLMSRKLNGEINLYKGCPLKNSYRYASFILLYAYLSFFGIGNLSSISSFDPNTGRLFMAGDTIIFTGFLVLLKLSIPSIVIIASMYLTCSFVRHNVREIFISLFLMADTMSLYFLLQMRSEGSWREVRYSVAHFMIAHCSIFVIMIISGISKLLLSSRELIISDTETEYNLNSLVVK
ncbi:uncharacterized protein Dwil_GK19203 [Drosophila willistoni]|uniref:GPI ethanolamine phosphate transferase 1 n=1 Tax=Drosophila willistoni TaxID=7260 RepID=B4NAV8_DROWI|nr:GPI ethanolamine phosphate transferase 1 [Drosophila willistoni]EDW80922.1 uncharacterized protein Dwil_GK19203 [Drosophila willistoni]